MVQMHEQQQQINEETEKRSKFCINDSTDILIEILQRLDDGSLGVAACVCRLWRALTRNDSLWEHLCFRHVSPPPDGVRSVVAALGGFRRLYMVCVKPVLSRLGKMSLGADGVEIEVSLSLFCVDYYERVLLAGGGRRGGEAAEVPPSSLMLFVPSLNV